MVKNQVTAVFVLFSLVFMTVTSGRFFQDTDDRDKRQIGDLRTAEYLALITLNNMYNKLPAHCRSIGCGLIDVRKRLAKRTMSDQRIAEIQALIALSRGNGIPVGHGQINPMLISVKRTMSDQRMAEIQAKIALSKGYNIPIGHGKFNLDNIGRRKKRSLDTVFRDLSDNEKITLLDILMSRDADQLS